jgi:hypothetical protein
MRHLFIKGIIAILFYLMTLPVFGQNYPFAKDFVKGNIILKDSAKKAGLIKWYPDPGEKLKFKENENGDTKKYTPEDLLGFTVDSFQFVSLFNFEMYANDYAFLGKTSKVKHSFGQLLGGSTFKVYLVMTSGYNAMLGGIQTYTNFLFEKKTDSDLQYTAFPFMMRMKDKKFEKAKDELYIFFKDHPEIIDKIRACKQQDNFFEIIDLVKKVGN